MAILGQTSGSHQSAAERTTLALCGKVVWAAYCSERNSALASICACETGRVNPRLIWGA